MKNILLCFALASLLFACKKPPIDEPSNQDSTETSYQWTRLADFPGRARTSNADSPGRVGTSNAAYFVIGNNFYFGLGKSSGPENSDCFKDFWSFDIQQEKWTQLSDFTGLGNPTGVGYSFAINETGYISLGLFGEDTCPCATDTCINSDAWKYSIENNWTPISMSFGTLPWWYLPGGKSLVIDDTVFLLVDDGADGLSLFAFDYNSDTWIQKSNFPSNVDAGVFFSIGKKGYVGLSSLYDMDNREFWEYTPETDAWKRLNDFAGEGRLGSVGFNLKGKGYVVGGNTKSGYSKDVWEYTAQTDTWKKVGDIPFESSMFADALTIGDTTAYLFVDFNRPLELWKFTVK